MKSQALRELVNKIFSDEKARSEFVVNPHKVLSRYNLTESEKRAVLSTQSRVGLVASGTQLEGVVGPMSWWS